MTKRQNDEVQTSDTQFQAENNQTDQETTRTTGKSKVGEGIKGGLYIVATPIGNAQDITLRALTLLQQADTILCEDTRVTAKLLAIHGIGRKNLLAYHEHNGEKMRPKVLEKLKNNEIVVQVSDAGTPLINDPGYRLVQMCQEENLPVTTAPGASSVITGLVLSGLPSDRFLYVGFLPNKTTARKKELEALKHIPATLVFLESPRRTIDCLKDMAEVFGPDRQAAMTRELTKKFEEVQRAPLQELISKLEDRELKGEVVLIVGPPMKSTQTEELDLDDLLTQALSRLSLKDAVAEVVSVTGLKKRTVYNRALELNES